MSVIVVGAGIGGLTLALMLQRAGVDVRVLEAAGEIRPLGAGINVLPHASRELGRLGLEAALTPHPVLTKEAACFNRFGQLIPREPLGRFAGYDAPQYSIHRGDLQRVARRAGADPRGGRGARVPDGRPGSAAVVDRGARDAPAHPMLQRGSSGAGHVGALRAGCGIRPCHAGTDR